jgi:hypothetical protein
MHIFNASGNDTDLGMKYKQHTHSMNVNYFHSRALSRSSTISEAGYLTAQHRAPMGVAIA